MDQKQLGEMVQQAAKLLQQHADKSDGKMDKASGVVQLMCGCLRACTCWRANTLHLTPPRSYSSIFGGLGWGLTMLFELYLMA